MSGPKSRKSEAAAFGTSGGSVPSRLRGWLAWLRDVKLGWGGKPSSDLPAVRAPSRRALRPGLRVYAIGDIHGHAVLLDRLIVEIHADLQARQSKKALLVFLGDYVDRGPDSAGVIERLARGPFRLPRVTLRGNHEQALLDALSDIEAFARWCGFGGLETMASYGVDVSKVKRRKGLKKAQAEWLVRLPKTHRDFLAATKLSFGLGDYFFAHAGARPGIGLDQQQPDDLLWIRDEFLNADWDFGKVTVHGHTPRPQPENLSGRINVDTGAFKWGVLTAVVLEGNERHFISVRE